MILKPRLNVAPALHPGITAVVQPVGGAGATFNRGALYQYPTKHALVAAVAGRSRGVLPWASARR